MFQYPALYKFIGFLYIIFSLLVIAPLYLMYCFIFMYLIKSWFMYAFALVSISDLTKLF
jgi:hypothetical protein